MSSTNWAQVIDLVKVPSERDVILVKAVNDGDTRAFAYIVSIYQKRIKALGMSFFKNVSDADDFVQDVFVKVYTNLKTFRFESMFSTWIMRIAYNTAINSIKRRKEYISLSNDAEILDRGRGPEENNIRRLTVEIIRESIKELPEKYAVCLDMYFFYDMSYNEISDVIGLPVNTIKSHVFRAKKILKDKLADFEY